MSARKGPGFETKFATRKKASLPPVSVPASKPTKPKQELLTHFVVDSFGNGAPASDLEERWARGLDKVGVDYHHLFITWSRHMGMNPLDFLVIKDGTAYQMPIDNASFIHAGTEGHDRRIDAMISDQIRKQGYNLYPIIMRLTERELGNQEDADRTAREMFG